MKKGICWLKLIPPLMAFFLLPPAAQSWMAEWIYPLDESSLWRPSSYGSLFEEIQRIQTARRFAPKDPRYAYKLTLLYQKAISEGLLDSSPKGRVWVETVVKDFEEEIKHRSVFPEYLVGFALFLLSAGEQEEELPAFLRGQNFLSLADEKVEQALFLGRQNHAIRAFVATYDQYRGWDERALQLWRSILTEDPSQTPEVLKRCCENHYKDSSFLSELAPEKSIEALTRFQDLLITFKTKAWGEKFYLETLPLLIEKEEQTGRNATLLEVIARTYRAAGDPYQASLWYKKAFRFAKTPDSQASLLLANVDVLLQQGRHVEARLLLKEHLDLSSLRKEILVRYADISGHLGEREEAIKALKTVVRQKEVSPDGRDLLAFFLYEEGRYPEAASEWRTLLRETRGTPYETANKDRLLQRILECEELTGSAPRS